MSRKDAVIEVLSDERGQQPAAGAASDRRAGAVLSPRAPPPFTPRRAVPARRSLHRRTGRPPHPEEGPGEQDRAAPRLRDSRACKIKDARQTLTIGSADVETAERLDTALNAPIAIVHRSVVDQAGCLVFTGEGIYRGDAVRIDMKLK